jgi:nitrite reductase/ring-hydroxylating ferredoxin subunit
MAASPQQPNFVEVCSVEDIWEGEMQSVCVRDAAILLLKIGGRLRAYQGRCPHQGVALVEGDLDGVTLTCRAHHWQFNAMNGEGINPRNAKLKCFSTEIVNGKIHIGMPSDNADDCESTRSPPGTS